MFKSLTRLAWCVALASRLIAAARADVPLVLPPELSATDWQGPASLAGFRVVTDKGGPAVLLLADGASWQILVRQADGTERRVPVAAARTAREREDLLWLAASLAAPLQVDALSLPAGRAPPSTGAPTTAPPAQTPPPSVAPTKPPAPAAQASASRSAPPPAPPAAPPAPPAAPPAPSAWPQETAVLPAEADAAPPPLPGGLRAPDGADAGTQTVARTPTAEPEAWSIRLMGLGGLSADASGGRPSLGGRVDVGARARVGAGLLLGAELALLSRSRLDALGDTERYARQELDAEVGFQAPGDAAVSLLLAGGVGRLSFLSGDPPTLQGARALPFLGLHLDGRALERGRLAVLLRLGLTRDLARVEVSKGDLPGVTALPATRAALEVGFLWRP